MENIYDNKTFFDAYARMFRSRDGLAGAGEWHQFRNLFPDMSGMKVLDLGCGYGWHCKYAAEQGAASVLGIDLSEKMIARAREINGEEAVPDESMLDIPGMKDEMRRPMMLLVRARK